MSTAIYHLGLACLFTHELDAVTHSEWRLLPVLGGLSDGVAESTFVALHVPLFFLVLVLSHHPKSRVRTITRAAVAGFLVLHAVLHFALSSASGYEFHGALSRTLIVAAGGLGIAYLLLQRRGSSTAGHAA